MGFDEFVFYSVWCLDSKAIPAAAFLVQVIRYKLLSEMGAGLPSPF